MAAINLPSKNAMAGERTAIRLRFIFDHAAEMGIGSTSEHFIDIAQCLSLVNRRLYRQGLMYYVAGVSMHSEQHQMIQVATVADTWVTKNAWVRGFTKWNQMNARAITAGQTLPIGKYHDFKVFMSLAHRANGANSLPYSAGWMTGIEGEFRISPFSSGEWTYSRYVSVDEDVEDEFEITMIGDHVGNITNWDAVSLVESYKDIKVRPKGEGILEPEGSVDDVGTAILDPLSNLWDDAGNQESIAEDLLTDSDEAPYDGTFFIGDSEHNFPWHQGTMDNGGSLSNSGAYLSGFSVPLGLMRVTIQGGDDADCEIVVDIQPGHYQGVHAERLT